jgi:hypothetical protein
MKSLMLLWQTVLEELGDRCRASTSLDLKKAKARFEHEGVSFLTITLTDFGKDFEKSLSQGYVDHDLFKGFSFSGGLPRFLGGFLDLVFNRRTGQLVDVPCIEAIYAIRQLSLMFGKINLECSDERKKAALQKYVDCEQEVRFADAHLTPTILAEFERIGLMLFGDVLSNCDNLIATGQLIPKHGPGGTADGLKGNRKFRQQEWTERLEKVFSCSDYLIPNARYYQHLDTISLLEPGQERPVKVILVPKTLKTPRIIAIEPTCMQYAQQAVMECLVDSLESSSLFGRNNISSWLVGFSDQNPNREMAKEGSQYGNLATLDLSEASDRVSNQHVRALLRRHPHLSDAVDACRSRKADVPGHGVLRLAKFASMGSALCFPFEAMVFATVIFLGIQSQLNRPLTRKDIQSFRGSVRIYGDDIIVPVGFAHSVVAHLESFGFRVNTNKSFLNGSFRESCGREFYDGSDVSIVRVRRTLPVLRTDVEELLSTVSLRNQVYLSGLWRTAQWLDERLEKLLKLYPTVHPSSSVLGRHSLLDYQVDKVSESYHAPLVRGYVVLSTPPRDHLDDIAALLKWFLKRGEEPFADKRHLERQGRPVAVDIKLRWAPPY